jgi:flagellar hook assembly protein FlgD
MYYDPLPRPRVELSTGDITTENHSCNYLNEPYPNPFNPQTSIRFGLKEAANVSLKIYDVRGQLVKTLHDNKNLPAGKYQENWNGVNNDGTRVRSGIYFLKLVTSNGYSETRKMVLIQ